MDIHQAPSHDALFLMENPSVVALFQIVFHPQAINVA